jgi:CRP/FNR family transcriptional regulator, nitrogen oxide reductase regulator
MGDMQATRLSLKSPAAHGLQNRTPDALRDVSAVSATQAIPFRYIDASEKKDELNLDRSGLRMDARLACVQQAPLFRGLSLGDCTYIACQAKERVLPRREMLFCQGDPRRNIFLIASGRVKVTQLGSAGDEVILWLKGPGEILDGLGMAAGSVHGSSAQAIEPCNVISWEAKTIESLTERLPLLHRNMVVILAECLQGMQDRFHELATEKVAMRLARTLVRLLRRADRNAGEFVRISLSREELAQMTGTTLFAVSRLLSEWTQRGIVVARREAVVICDDSRLLELAEQEAA